jgi:xanthine dehydrogenase accessory factor
LSGKNSKDNITAGDAAAAALSVQDTGESVSVVLHACAEQPAKRMLVFPDGHVEGSLGSAILDDAAREIAAESLTSGKALSRTVRTGESASTLYVETHTPGERLVVVGAGHIAVPLATLGGLLNFQVIVLDDREEFADENRFTAGVHVKRANFEADPFAGVAIDDRTYVALVTRGHRWDFDCLTRLLELPVLPRYIGMIGSRRRVRAAFEALEAASVDRTRLGLIHAPIGLDIGADTPAEIAVSIAAEIVAIRRDAVVPSLKDREQVVERLLPDK